MTHVFQPAGGAGRRGYGWRHAVLAAALACAGLSSHAADPPEVAFTWQFVVQNNQVPGIFKEAVQACRTAISKLRKTCDSSSQVNRVLSAPAWVVWQTNDPRVDNQFNSDCEYTVTDWRLGCQNPPDIYRQIAGNFVEPSRICPPEMVHNWRYDGSFDVDHKCVGPMPTTPPSCPTSSNPVHLTKGWKFWTETDLTYPFEFSRYYTSRPQGGFLRSGLGSQWRHTYDRELIPTSVSTQRWMARQDGTLVLFTQGTNGLWTPSDGSRIKMTTESFGFRVQSEADEIEDYDTNGRLISILMHDSRKFTMTYDADSGLLATVTDLAGRTLTFSPTSDLANIASMTDPAGKVWQFTYTTGSPKQLAGVSSPAGNSSDLRTYHYENSNNTLLTGITAETGHRYATYTYGSSARVTGTQKFSDATHPTNQYTYSYPNATTINVTTPLGATIGYSSAYSAGAQRITGTTQPCASCGGANAQSTQYDTYGNPVSRTDFNGNVTTSAYSDGARGLATERVEASNDTSTSSVKRTTRTTWDPTFRVPTARRTFNAANAMEAKQLWIYNTRGQTTATCEVDPAADPTDSYDCASTTVPSSGVRRTTYTYCEAADVAASNSTCPILGLVKSVNGPRATTDAGMGGLDDVATYTYYPSTDESGCATTGGICHRKGDLWKVTNALGHVSETASYDKNGRPTRVKDANGVITDTTYHSRGWVLERTVRVNANGSASADDATTTFAYDAAGNATRVTQPDGSYLDYAYDDAFRLTDVVDNLGNRIHYTLDAAGNRVKEDTYDASYTPANPATGLKRSMSSVYNQLGRLTKALNATSAPTFDMTPFDGSGLNDGYDANGNAVLVQDGLAVETRKEYDPLNRLRSTIGDYLGTDPETGNVTSIYTYDARDNLRTVTDPDALATTYSYDGLNNLIDLDSPDTGHTDYAYDKAGNRTSQTDSRGIASTYTYDALNRLVGVVYPSTNLNVTFAYDSYGEGSACSLSSVGRLAQMIDASGTTTYCYDQRGNVTSKSHSVDSVSLDVIYTYDKADRLTSITYPDGGVAGYSRDIAGRITGLSWTPAGSSSPINVVSNASYYPFGPLNVLTYGNGRTLTKSYDADYAIDSVASSASDGLKLDFTVDVMGNIVSASDTIGATTPTRKYLYDHLYRLTRVNDGNDVMKEDYGYNKTGDRTLKQFAGQAAQVYSYLAGTHKLASVDSANRTYDANGNTTARGDGKTFDYDDRNRLAEVYVGSTKYVSSYNGKGERVSKFEESLATSLPTRYVYDEKGQLLMRREPGTSAPTFTAYLYIDGTPVAQISAGALTYLDADHLGTPRVAADSTTNAKLWAWDFFGSTFGEHAASGSIDMSLRYAGQMFDSESGLHYNYFRDYDPKAGRYIESDPIGLKGGTNTYSYVHNRPLRMIDPKGLYTCGQCASVDCLLYGHNQCPDPPKPLPPPPAPNLTWQFECYYMGKNCWGWLDPLRPRPGCRATCNMKYQAICTGAGWGASFTVGPEVGGPLAGACIFVKALACDVYCDYCNE